MQHSKARKRTLKDAVTPLEYYQKFDHPLETPGFGPTIMEESSDGSSDIEYNQKKLKELPSK
jgi:hypothetical protein